MSGEKQIMMNKSKGTYVEDLSANILNTRFENISESLLENAKNRIIDVVGCSIGGTKAAGNPVLVDLVKSWGGKEESTILGYGGKVPSQNAAMVNSIMARSFDFEVVGSMVEGEWIGSHISGTTVITAIAMGEAAGINGKELITALLAGDDVAARIIASSGFSPNKAWDITGTVNAFGATAIAGRILGLNALQMRHAFGIVLNYLAGSMQSCWDGAATFKMQEGISSRNGIFAAQLAKAGWTGIEDALFSRYGYYNIYTEGCVNPEILTNGLGEKYYSEGHFKPYPCCGGLHAAIDCALAITDNHDIKVNDIEEIILYVSQIGANGFFAQPFKIGHFSHANAAFNLRYVIANTLLRKSVKSEHFSDESIRDPEIDSIISRITIAESPEVPMLGAGLKVKMKGGQEFNTSVDFPEGYPFSNPMSKGKILEKFRANIDFSQMVSTDNAEESLNLMEHLEELDNVRDMVKLLVP
jgi:2-methylcitrate dehydratase PrpD